MSESYFENILTRRNIRYILAFIVFFLLIWLVVIQLNSYQIAGVYQGETENGAYVISGTLIDLPFNLPDNLKGEYIYIEIHGFSRNVYEVPPDERPEIENMMPEIENIDEILENSKL